MSMRLSSNCIRFMLGTIPVVGNTATGAIVGLTPEGASLCDALLEHDVCNQDIPIDCRELLSYLQSTGFVEDELSDGHDGSEDTVPQPITSAYLHVTNRCNLSCVGCYSRDAARNRAADPDLAALYTALDTLAALGVQRLVISGGEPFVRSDLPHLAAHAREVGISYIAIITNGTLVTPDALENLKGSVDVISVSFDGASAQAPARIRTIQLFNVLVDAVRHIQEAGIQAHILPTIHAENVEEIPSYLALAEQLGATVGFSLLSGTSSELGRLCMTEGCLSSLADRMSAIAFNQEGPMALGEDVWSGTLSARRRCGAGYTNVSIAADGSVYPCHMLHYPALKLGNAFSDPASSLLEALAAFRLPTVDEISSCQSCNKRYLCGGGCRGRSMAEYGCLDARDPYCAYYNRAIDLAVDAFVRSLSMNKE